MATADLKIEWSTETKDQLALLEHAIHGDMSEAIDKGTKKCALYVVGEITRRIQAGGYERLAMLTQAIRNANGYGNVPLQKTNVLIRSLAQEVTGNGEAQIGLLLQGPSRGRSGPQNFANIALVLHDGATIRITDAMRAAFSRVLHALSSKFGLRKGNATGASVLRIPPRPFIKEVFEDAAVVERIEEIFYDSILEGVRFLR